VPPLTAETLTTAAGPRPRPLRQPLVCSVWLDDETAATRAAALTEPCAYLATALHPALRQWLAAAGWQTTATSARLRPSPASVDDPRVVPLRDAAGSVLAEAVVRGTRPAALRVDGHTIRTGPGRLHLDGDQTGPVAAADAAAAAAAQQRIVCGSPGWAKLSAKLAAALVLLPDPADPSQVRCVDRGQPTVHAPLSAAAQLGRSHLDRTVAAHPEAIDLADLAAAGGHGRPGLLPRQDQLASALVASHLGVVLAARPGTGKTVISAAALAETLRDGDRALIAAPAAVIAQWVEELGRWAPRLPVTVAHDVAGLRRRLRPGAVCVTSHDVAARWATTGRIRLATAVVDEAAVVTTSSARADGLWALRRLAVRGWALTGTPEQRHGGRDVADLVAWARNRPRGSVTAAAAERYTPVVCGLGTTEGTPAQQLTVEPLTPTTTDWQWLAELARTAAQRTGFGGANARDLLRRGVGDPTAVGSPASAATTKRAAAVDRLAAHAAGGGSALLCTASAALAKQVCAELADRGVSAGVLDASAAGTHRIGLLGAFYAGTVPVLAVTPASQRGVNLQQADLVVHLDLPASRAAFEQRNARAARIGSPHASVEVWVPYLAGTWDATWVAAFTGSGDIPDVCALSCPPHG